MQLDQILSDLHMANTRLDCAYDRSAYRSARDDRDDLLYDAAQSVVTAKQAFRVFCDIYRSYGSDDAMYFADVVMGETDLCDTGRLADRFEAFHYARWTG